MDAQSYGHESGEVEDFYIKKIKKDLINCNTR
jgi:hypothetical protein